MNKSTVKYRIAITEYSTLKGFGNSCSIEIEYDTVDSVKNALEQAKNIFKNVANVRADYSGSNMGFVVTDNLTGLMLTKVAAYPYSISEDGRELLYRAHRITTEFDEEISKDVLVVHRIDGRPYVYRTTIQLALDTIDWLCCNMENASIARMGLEAANKEKEGE